MSDEIIRALSDLMMLTPPVTASSNQMIPTPDKVREEKLERLNQRIDRVLKDNSKAETLAMLLCTLLFLAGLGLFIAGYVLREPFYIGSGALVEVGIIWPIKRIIDLRSENVRLSVLPGMLDLLPREEAVKVWREFYGKWLSQK